jgi:hypothetical protein
MKLLKHYFAVSALPVFLVAGCGSSSAPLARPAGNADDATAITAPETEASSNVAEQPEGSDVTNTNPSAPVDLMAVEMAAYESAKPIFEEQCGGCHTPDESLKKPKKGVSHFSMAGYPFDGHHKTELGQSIRVAIGATDKPATMPQDDPGSIEGADREAILAWSDAFDAAASAKVGYHASSEEGGHEHSSGHGHKKDHGHPKKGHEHKKGHKHPKKSDKEHKKREDKKKTHDHKEKHDHSKKHSH